VRCEHCGGSLVCAACGIPAEAGPAASVDALEGLVTRALSTSQVSPSSQEDQLFLIVARGHEDLLEQIKTVVGDIGWVRVIEDRRRASTVLPRDSVGGTPPSK
jgi:hypothetical protein